MKFYILKNPTQDEQFKSFISEHEKSVRNDNFDDLVKQLVLDIRNNYPDLVEKSHYIYYLFRSINHIIHSYKNFKESRSIEPYDPGLGIFLNEKLESAYRDEEETLLVFFVNAQAFLYLVQKYTQLKVDCDLKTDISDIRNYLIHSHEKDIEKRKYFVMSFFQRNLFDHSILRIIEEKSGDMSHELHFSVDIFYFTVKDIFEKLKNNPRLLKNE